MKHLLEFEVRSFRNVRPTKLEFRPGINVVLGKNAAGKTTLLNVLAEGLNLFALPVEERSTRAVLGNGSARLERETTIAAARDSDLLSRQRSFSVAERFEAKLDHGSFTALLSDEQLELDGQKKPAGKPPLLSLFAELGSRSEPLVGEFFQLATTEVQRLDESLEYFDSLLAFSQTRVAGTAEPSMGSVLPMGLRDFLVQHDASVGPFFTARFLGKSAAAMGFDSAQGRIDVESKSTAGKVETRLTNLRFAFASGRDSFTHSSLSYGQKRLLSFFAISDACPEVLIADELVNGLHHEWIRACIDEVGDRQAFLTSQNPLLLDYLEFESAEDVQRGFVLCSRETTGEATQLVWRNPTTAEATEFFAAYETGIQTVSEILIAKGFW